MAARLLPTLPTFAPGPLASTQLTALATYAAFWANPPSFRAEQHSTVQSIPNSANTQVICETTIHDSDSGLSLVSPFSYVIPFAGAWDFFGGVGLAGSAVGIRAPSIGQNGVYINGAAPILTPPSTNTLCDVAATGVPCNVGDVIGLYMYQTSGGALGTYIIAPQQYSWFSGRLTSLQTP